MRIAPDEARRQFDDEVFPTELEYIENRRQSVGDDIDPPLNPKKLRTENDLVGLALSGGGIRSASFGLGVMQALGSRFSHIDYLSTVSGGGFIGASVSALMANASSRGEQPAKFPFPVTPTEREPPALSHLRNNSSYVTPDGPGDVFRLLAVLLRGIILNSLALFPFLLAPCFVILWLYGQQLSDRAAFDDQVKWVDALLERYYGDRFETEREVKPLLDVLKAEALLRTDEGKTDGDVIHQLRSAHSFRDASTVDLVTGNGTEQSPYRLTPDTSREDVARALLAGDVLQRYEVIEEIELLARLLEQDGYVDRGKQEELPSLYDAGNDVDPGKYDELLSAVKRRDWIRPGTKQDWLLGAMKDIPIKRLKPMLQALYNGEYFNEAVIHGLVEEELRRPRAYYAYGWYEARVGQAHETSWYARQSAPSVRIKREIEQLSRTFGDECIPGLELLRPQTTRDDVVRLLRFKELILQGDGRDECQLSKEVIEALYLGEYLAENWVQERSRPFGGESESQRLALALTIPDFPTNDEELLSMLGDRGGIERFRGVLRDPDVTAIIDGWAWADFSSVDGFGTVLKRLFPLAENPSVDERALDLLKPKFPTNEDELVEMLVLGDETITADLQGVLRDRGLLATVRGWSSADLSSVSGLSTALKELGTVVAELRPMLDDAWVADQIYVYSYGWHRTRLGTTYPGTWCGNTEASLGEPVEGCPKASDEAWQALYRVLRDPSRWDPDRLGLPIAWLATRVALVWVFLFPLVVIVTRAFNGWPDRLLNWREFYERTFGALLVLILGVVLLELLPYAVHHLHYGDLRGQSSRTLAVGFVSLLVTAVGGPALAVLQRFGRTVALAVLAVSGPLLLLTLFLWVMDCAVYSPQMDALLWLQEDGRRVLDRGWAGLLFGITVVVSVGLAWLIDINSTSLHGLYRDRLSSAFMVGRSAEGGVEAREDLALERICPPGSGAPYHLINVAMNLQGSGDRSLRGRNCASLFFSRDHIGGPRTGFCRTADMARLFPQAHLGGAMSVSGAAVSPNMGRYKSGSLAVLMSLLNTRLALWMPHPAVVRQRTAAGWWRKRTPAILLLRELLGWIHDRGRVINISDGGHLENTGALELLRRRCRKIILIDGEADPGMAFGGLANLLRMARIDLGIEIDIDLSALRPDDKGLSLTRSAVGVIHYPACRDHGEVREPTESELIYVKLAVTGNERASVSEYRARNPRFPHQSTGDQAFDEGQFEAYRELGHLAGSEVLEAVGGTV